MNIYYSHYGKSLLQDDDMNTMWDGGQVVLKTKKCKLKFNWIDWVVQIKVLNLFVG